MIGRALAPGGWGLLLAGLLSALIGLSALVAALRWPAWAPAAPIAATVRVLSPADSEGLQRATGALEALAQVRTAAAMQPERAAELLAAWSGEAAAAADLSGLALIEVELAAGADPALLEAALAKAGVTAEVFAPPAAGRSDSAVIGALSLAAAGAGMIVFGVLAAMRLAPSAPALATLAHLGAQPGAVAAAAGWRGLGWGLICAGAAAPAALGLVSLLSPGAAWAPSAQLGAGIGALCLAALAAVCAAIAARAGYDRGLREGAP
jgi:hypothetical protein